MLDLMVQRGVRMLQGECKHLRVVGFWQPRLDLVAYVVLPGLTAQRTPAEMAGVGCDLDLVSFLVADEPGRRPALTECFSPKFAFKVVEIIVDLNGSTPFVGV